jgi:tetratricopeptide (TPR) repeat protein
MRGGVWDGDPHRISRLHSSWRHNMDKTLPPEDHGHLLEGPRRMSESMLWRMQQNYYRHSGVEAWRSGAVPHYITSNPFVARTYCDVVLSYIRDLRESGELPQDQPLYIVELGAGSGRFSYHFLHSFLPRLRQSSLRDVKVKMVLTDCVPENLEFWRGHPKLQPFFEAEVLDVALYDAERDTTLNLQCSGVSLTEGSSARPMVVFANYFFDSLPQDCFWSSGGALYESLVNIYTDREEADLDDPTLLKRLHLHYTREPVERAVYYADAEYDQTLYNCTKRLNGSAFGFPCGAMRCMESLRRISGGRLFLLTSDKGWHREEDLLGANVEPPIAVHTGCFSVDLNYLALGLYASLKSGQMLGTAHRHNSINLVAFLFGNAADYPDTRLAFSHAAAFGPDEFFTIKRIFEEKDKIPSIEAMLALFRLSNYDVRVLLGTMGSSLAVFEQLASAPDHQKRDVAAACAIAWQGYFPIGEPVDVAYNIGTILAKMGLWAEALVYYRYSEQSDPDKAHVAYSIALCLYHLRDLTPARAANKRALELSPNLGPAHSLQTNLDSTVSWP